MKTFNVSVLKVAVISMYDGVCREKDLNRLFDRYFSVKPA